METNQESESKNQRRLKKINDLFIKSSRRIITENEIYVHKTFRSQNNNRRRQRHQECKIRFRLTAQRASLFARDVQRSVNAKGDRQRAHVIYKRVGCGTPRVLTMDRGTSLHRNRVLFLTEECGSFSEVLMSVCMYSVRV